MSSEATMNSGVSFESIHARAMRPAEAQCRGGSVMLDLHPSRRRRGSRDERIDDLLAGMKAGEDLGLAVFAPSRR